MDVVAVHQRSQFIFLALAAQHQPLLCGKAYPLAPVSDLERHMGIGLADLLIGRPTRRAVLPITHGAGLDAAECIVVSAGTGEFLDEGNFEMVSFPEKSVPKGADFGVRVSGDSMEPVYHDGQIVWVEECETLAVGEVGIFAYDGDGYLKVYCEQEPSEQQKDAFTDSYGCLHMQPVMLSYNQAYAPKVIMPDSRFQVVGRVL